jgi:hypothetical protein
MENAPTARKNTDSKSNALKKDVIIIFMSPAPNKMDYFFHPIHLKINLLLFKNLKLTKNTKKTQNSITFNYSSFNKNNQTLTLFLDFNKNINAMNIFLPKSKNHPNSKSNYFINTLITILTNSMTPKSKPSKNNILKKST